MKISKNLDFIKKDIILGTYDDIVNVTNCDLNNYKIIMLEPLSNINQDKYYKSILINNFVNNELIVLISKDTNEEYIN